MSQYEQDLEPLLDCVEIIFQTELLPFITNETHKYKETFLVSESSKKDFSTHIKLCVKKVLVLLSKQYVQKLKTFYLSEEGLLMYIFSALYKLTNVEEN